MGAGRAEFLPLVKMEYEIAIDLDVMHAIPLASVESVALGLVGDRAAKLYEQGKPIVGIRRYAPA